MNEKQINRWLRHRFSHVGWVLLAYFALMYLLVEVSMTADLAAHFLKTFPWGGEPDWDAILGNAWGYIVTIAVGIVILHSWKGPDYWKQEVFRREQPITARVLFAAITLCVGAQMVNSLWVMLLEAILNQFGRSVMPYLETVSGATETFSMFLYASILAPIAEEILFRGFILRSLRPYGKRFAILGSAFLFGIFHGNLMQTPYAFLVGLVLGWVAVEYSARWAVAVHMFVNLVTADLLTRLLNLLPEMAAATIDWAVFGGFTIGAIVILAVNRKKIRAYRESEWMDRRCLKCFFTNAGILVMTGICVILMLTTL